MHSNDRDTAHEFAFYWPESSSIFQSVPLNDSFVMKDEQLYHRMTRVLRLQPGARVTFFNEQVHLSAQLRAIGAQQAMECQLLEKAEHVPLTPTIYFVLPLLKRDAFEAAIYSLVEEGANELQLVQTQKAQRAWGGTREMERLRAVMIAAAEQSKQYVLPTIHEPKPLATILQTMPESDYRFFFDPEGADLFPVLQQLKQNKLKHMLLFVGPEGDLTNQEKELLKAYNIQFIHLTRTILRAQQAVAVGVGIIRSLVR